MKTVVSKKELARYNELLKRYKLVDMEASKAIEYNNKAILKASEGIFSKVVNEIQEREELQKYLYAVFSTGKLEVEKQGRKGGMIA